MPLRHRVLPALLCAVLVPGQLAGAATEQPDGARAGMEASRDAAPADPLAAQVEVRPAVDEGARTPLQDVAAGAVPRPDAVARALTDELGDPDLGDRERVAAVVRDVLTDEVLFQQHEESGFTPASLTKLLTAAAVSVTLPAEDGFPTTVVAGAEPGQLVLVAGGDMLLAVGPGNPGEVAGRAGLADLAAQVAASLNEQAGGQPPDPAAEVTLQLDVSYAAGADRPSGWTDFWMRGGYTGPITMLGLAQDRAWPGHPAPARPAQSAAMAFRAALEEQGVKVAGKAGAPVPEVTAPPGAAELGAVMSAPAGEVLRLALEQSDNALVEQLARQAAVHDGARWSPRETADWVLATLAEEGFDVTGVVLADVSGLSDGTRLPARLVADVLVAGADGGHPDLQRTLANLPVAGLNGTLWDRFHLDVHEPAVGVARAKTGTLPQVSSLAGYVVTADGRLVTYVFIADRLGQANPLEARSVLDEMVAELGRCGC